MKIKPTYKETKSMREERIRLSKTTLSKVVSPDKKKYDRKKVKGKSIE